MSYCGFISYINTPTRVWESGELCINHIFSEKKKDKYNIDSL